MYSGLKSMPLD